MRTASLVFAWLCLAVLPAHATRDEFCAGFAEGFRSAQAANVAVPACPVQAPTPSGSTPFREGVKAGIRAARALLKR